MKPELIFISEKDGMITMSREDLERIVDKAYKAGQADRNYYSTSPWTISPTWNDVDVPVRQTEITCKDMRGDHNG